MSCRVDIVSVVSCRVDIVSVVSCRVDIVSVVSWLIIITSLMYVCLKYNSTIECTYSLFSFFFLRWCQSHNQAAYLTGSAYTQLCLDSDVL